MNDFKHRLMNDPMFVAIAKELNDEDKEKIIELANSIACTLQGAVSATVTSPEKKNGPVRSGA